jgi:DNA repair protein RadC
MSQSSKTTGEPCAMKVASTVRRGADGKGTQVTSPAAYPTKPAILGNAAAVILAHNHPSGDPQPSQEDRVLTTRLVAAGKLLGIGVLDHFIIGDGTSDYFSFADAGSLHQERN